MTEIPDKLYFKIGEVCKILGVKPHTLRFWEHEIEAIKPKKSQAGHRLYSREELQKLIKIKQLRYEKKLQVSGVNQQLMQEKKGRINVEAVDDAPIISDETKAKLRDIRNRLLEIAKKLK